MSKEYEEMLMVFSVLIIFYKQKRHYAQKHPPREQSLQSKQQFQKKIRPMLDNLHLEIMRN